MIFKSLLIDKIFSNITIQSLISKNFLGNNHPISSIIFNSLLYRNDTIITEEITILENNNILRNVKGEIIILNNNQIKPVKQIKCIITSPCHIVLKNLQEFFNIYKTTYEYISFTPNWEKVNNNHLYNINNDLYNNYYAILLNNNNEVINTSYMTRNNTNPHDKNISIVGRLELFNVVIKNVYYTQPKKNNICNYSIEIIMETI